MKWNKMKWNENKLNKIPLICWILTSDAMCSLSISLLTSAIWDLVFCIFEFKKPELTEQDYYNKFCTKYYDVSCDKIKIK